MKCDFVKDRFNHMTIT